MGFIMISMDSYVSLYFSSSVNDTTTLGILRNPTSLTAYFSFSADLIISSYYSFFYAGSLDQTVVSISNLTILAWSWAGAKDYVKLLLVAFSHYSWLGFVYCSFYGGIASFNYFFVKESGKFMIVLDWMIQPLPTAEGDTV